jgi:hypothetical protein
LQEAAHKLDTEGLTREECITSSIFVKREPKNANWAGQVFEPVKPRVIVSCLPKVKVALGPWCVAFSKRLARVWDGQNVIYYESGSTQDDISEWFNRNLLKFSERALFEDDFSSFDATHSAYSFSWVNQVYARCGLAGLALKVMKTQASDQKLTARNGYKVKRPCFMKSGVPNTTIGNTLVNAAVHYSSFVEAGAKPGEDFVMMVRGDDMLAFLKPKFHDKAKELVKRYGFKTKVKNGHRVWHARFCSMAFYPTREGVYVCGPTVGKCLAKFAYTVKNVPIKEQAAHRRGVALGLLALTNHIPLLGDYVRNELAHTSGAGGKYMRKALDEVKLKYVRGSRHEPAPDADMYVANMYAMPVSYVHEIRALIGTMGEPGFYSSANSVVAWQQMLALECG